MEHYTIKIILKIFIFVSGLLLGNGIPAPLGVRTKMDISGSLNHLCGNDPTSSDTWPSCICLRQFSVQSSIHAGQYRGVVRSDGSVESKDGYGDFYNLADKRAAEELGIAGITRISGLKCIDEDGDEDVLNPIYNYLFNFKYVPGFKDNPYIGMDVAPYDNRTAIIIYHQDINKDNALTIVEAKIKINKTLEYDVSDIGDTCGPSQPLRTLQTMIWTFVNKITKNSTTDCNISKDSMYPINYEMMPIGMSLNSPLRCGEYFLDIKYHGQGEQNGMNLLIFMNLDYDVYCAPIEGDMLMGVL